MPVYQNQFLSKFGDFTILQTAAVRQSWTVEIWNCFVIFRYRTCFCVTV